MAVVVSQIETLHHTAVYLRYLKDASLANALLALLVVLVARAAHVTLTVYTRLTTDTAHERAATLKLLDRCLRAFQIVWLAHVAYATWQWTRIVTGQGHVDQPHQIEKQRSHVITDFIGEYDTGGHVAPLLVVLDLVVVLCQLQLLAAGIAGIAGAEMCVPQLKLHEYGILGILRLDTFASRDRGEELTAAGEALRVYGSTDEGREGRHIDVT
ncbi:LAMI_0A06788g1_1 [Lachancea mirantina]|uniref:LAMI_0A06788g1_1 n=1 Tax=Lachancea mirantina TaxID=1230905 RepID=A0A1G4IQD0_9SACH|nr:LAMI_0A06788g1_1 [Lachancea mirantina]